MPLTLVATDPAFQADTLFAAYRDRRATLIWADSRDRRGASSAARPRCSGCCRRSSGRSRGARPASSATPTRWARRCSARPSSRTLPDPLRSSLRNLMAVVGGRVAMVPAVARLQPRLRRPGARRALAGGRRHPHRQDPLAQPGAAAAAPPPARRSPPRSTLSCPSPGANDLRRHAHPGRRHRPRDHRPDREGARGHRAALQLGRGAGRAWRRSTPPAPRSPTPRSRASGRTPSRSRARSPPRSAPASARSTSASGRNSSSSPTCAPPGRIMPGGRFENVDIVLVRENLEGLYIGVEHFVQIGDDPRAVAESMAIVTRAGLRADRALRLRVRPPPRPEEGHHRPQGEHPQDGERPLPRGRPRRRAGVRGPGGVERHDRGQHRHAARHAARAVRRDGDHQHVRRHPERRGLGPGRRPGPRARRQHRHQGGDLRGRARQRARHRRARASPIPPPRCWPRP